MSSVVVQEFDAELPAGGPTESYEPALGGAATDEHQLLARLLAGDARAWCEFDTRYARLIYRCITRVTGRFGSLVGPEDIREIHATLCLSLLANDKHKLRSFEPSRGNKLGTWIGLLAIHTAYDFLRTVKREPKRMPLAEAERLSSELPDPWEVCAHREQAQIVADLLGSFTAKDREFITLYYGHELEPEQIAERMRISVKTVYSKKHKIRMRLSALLNDSQLAA
jgi:RNA polymerase sigma-70 factor, ECF subfamily